MRPQDRVPNELWLEIFGYLPPAAHRSLSSTHRTLYDIARPLGFAEFTLYLYPYEFQPPQTQLDYSLERLNFWGSPKIAPHIGIANLCALPALTHVDFAGVMVVSGERIDPAGLTLRVASFKTRYDYHLNDIWISLLARDTLRELDFDNPVFFARSEILPFPNVQMLTINDLPLNVNDTVTILNKFPNLREFTSDYRTVLRNLTPAQAASIFPVLQKYSGAYENLHIFVQRATLSHITLDAGFDFQRLATELQGITTLPNITSFTAQFTTSARNTFSKTEINTLFTLLPGLTELDLKLIPDPERDGSFTPEPTSFLKMLVSNDLLPSTLQSLSLEWDLFQYDTDSTEANDPIAPDPADVPELATLRAGLMAKCPALTYIFLNGFHFLFLWWKTSSSVWEATAHNIDDAEVLRGQKNERKYGTGPTYIC
ncbi:hypothetical protein MSAN_01687000 [Mycena sanguinolenta]|uniref:F-box domain-containing protein n=1 Tax=Mycena sanguinolenta TaxID=230812 RepID=A0A8H6XXW9_9AGAR|nr:hypothetical protein MSAN_01687000 [Mycena sanguinolenta]